MKLWRSFSLKTLAIGLVLFVFLLCRDACCWLAEFWRDHMFVRSVHKPESASPRSTVNPHVHPCQVPGCSREIPRSHLMCRDHWFEVCPEIRDQVETALANWLGHKDDVRPYLVARLRAIIHVAKLHGIGVEQEEASLARRLKSLEATQ